MLPDSKATRLRLCGDARALEQRDDDELMLLAGAGVSEAFELLLQRHQRAIRSYCARLCRDGSTADDVAQEIFVTLWRSRHTYQPKGRFRAYLFRIASSRCNNELKRMRLHVVVADEGNAPAIDPLALDAMVAAERSQRLYRLVRRLPTVQREAISLRFAAGLDYAEIAEVVNRSESTVRSRIFFGLNHLRRLIGKRGAQ